MNRRFNVYRRDSDRDDAILFYSFFFFFLKTRKEQGLLFVELKSSGQKYIEIKVVV